MTTGTAWRGEAAPGQRLQRGRLGGATRARDRSPAGDWATGGVPRRRGLRAAGDVQGAGGTRLGLRIRIPTNKNLELEIEDILFRSPGRPSHKAARPLQKLPYQADSWITPRRIVAKVEHYVGELFPRVGFIVTNLRLPNRAVVRFYNKRGAARPRNGSKRASRRRIGRDCRAIDSGRMRSRLQLSVLAYNLGKSLAAARAAEAR